MRILVTGGSGFIGSHVVDQLLDAGVTVRVVDLVTPAEPGVEFVEGDLGDPRVAAAAVADVDAVCHQAARVGLGVDFGDVRSYVSANDSATAVLLDALWRRSFCGRLVLASSMVIYGEGRSRCPGHGLVVPAARQVADLEGGCFEPRCPAAGCSNVVGWAPVDEDTPTDPRNIYAATKLHQEHLCALYGRESGAPVVALRYHNVYGPRMPLDTPYAGVASIFRSALAAGRAPEVFEDGQQTRDFVHVRDVARANVIALTGETATGGAYNIASGHPHTVGQLACALAGASRGPEPVVTGRWRLGDVRHIVASPALAASELGFRAEIDFAAGMAEFAALPIGA
ncbi:MAG TPA: NAD-dependent epimerase/dehydratase family protein [Acidimicrobiales bacterium]|nr:NAD-dependent epimerase/dehydratase family protein [Acidimicrobiales bacterium]